MMSISIWGPLKVDEFFRDYNWSGQPPKYQETETESESENQPSWLCLNVQKFFGQNNWRGEAIVKQPVQSAAPSSLSLTMPVAEFFGWAIWGGQPLTDAVSAPSSKSVPSISNSQNYNLSDLSDLF